MKNVKSNIELNCSLETILFDVEKVKCETPSNSDYEYDIFAYPNGEKLRVNSCSDRYELIPNSEIFPTVEKILNDNKIDFSVQYSHYNHAKFYANYIIEDKKYAFKVNGSNDIVKPQINVQHSYNGLNKYGIIFGYFRLICSNGLTIPVEEMKEYNLSMTGKHTISIQKSFETLNSTLQYFALNAVQVTLAITAKFEAMTKEQVINVDDRIKEVLNIVKITAVENNNFNTVDYIKGVIDSEKHLYNDNVNDWLIYNGINSYIFNDELNLKAPEKRAEMDSKVLQAIMQ